MNILVLNHYAGSPEMGMTFRPYYLGKEWIRMGHNVKIVTADYSHLRIKNPAVKKDFQETFIDGISYYWIKTCRYKGNGLLRALSIFLFSGKLFIKSNSIAKEWKPDVVIDASTHHLDTYAAQRICKKSGAKLIHEVRDMWPITLLELGHMKKYNPFVFLIQCAENSFCKHADYVVSLLPYAKEYLIKHGMRDDKFRVSSNGIVLEEWKEQPSIPKEYDKILKHLREEGKFIIGFLGSHTKSYALTYLIQAVQELDCLEIAVVFVGKGNQKEELKELASKKKCNNFYFLDPVPKSIIPTLAQRMDCLYVGAIHNDMFRFGICMNKLFDSMMSGKPILYAVDAPNNYVMDYHCGVSVEPESVEALEQGIRQLYTMSENEREDLGQNGRQAVLEHFTYEKLAADFAALF